jgi:hypothetical protein
MVIDEGQPTLLWIGRAHRAVAQDSGHRHRLPAGYGVMKDYVLGGLHHEYRLVKEAA